MAETWTEVFFSSVGDRKHKIFKLHYFMELWSEHLKVEDS